MLCCVECADGQTGCGKTFTMEGVRGVPELRGIIPTTFAQVFSLIDQNAAPGKQFLVRASYIEIYNEEVRDLTADNPKARCEVKEDKDKGVYIKGLANNEVKCEADLEAVMAKGNSNRTVGATLMNADSSRSHSIFCITVECSEPDTVKGGDEVKIKQGKLNLVDLAGSERQGKTQAEGVRLKEATKINLSLSALGNVIEALVANASGKARHIPYRDSKLTRLLQDSLGGNTKTVMIAAVSPADYNFDETLSTLRYANRAKNIKNKPKVNEDPKDALLREYQDEIKRLKMILEEKGLGDLLGSLTAIGGAAGKAAAAAAAAAAGPSSGRKSTTGPTAAKAITAESVVQPDNVEVVAVALTGSDGEERAQQREELEDDLQRLEDEKSKHARMKAVIDMEMDAQVAEVRERKEEERALDDRIAKEEKEGGAAEVVELLRAEKERLAEETAVKLKDSEDVRQKLAQERKEHEESIARAEEEMVARLAAEETRRKEIEDKYRFMTEKSESEKESLQQKLSLLQQKLLSGSEKRKGDKEKAEEQLRLMKEKQREMKRRQAELEAEKEAKEEKALFLEEQYSSMAEENAEVKRKLRKLASKYKQREDDMAAVEDELEREKEQHMADLRQSERETRLYRQICQALLTATDLDKIVVNSVWVDGREEWKLPNIDIPLMFPTISLHTQTGAVSSIVVTSAEQATSGPSSKLSWRSGGMDGSMSNKDSSALERAAAMAGSNGGGGWKERLHNSQNELTASSASSLSKYYQARSTPNESLGWRRSLLATLSTEQLQAMARQEKEQHTKLTTTTLSAEDAATRARLMSEQIDAITAGVRRRQHFQPTRKLEEEEKQQSSPAAAIGAADSGVKKRPAFQPAKIVTSTGSPQLSAALPDSAFNVPIRPAFSPAAPTSPQPASPQSAGVDLKNLPKGRPSFTPARI